MVEILIGVFVIEMFVFLMLLMFWLIVDMCNPDPYMSNWDFIKTCLGFREV